MALALSLCVDIARPKKKKHGRTIAIAAGIVALTLVTVALARLKPAAPTVQSSQVWPDTVKRGPMLREVRGPGTLVPEQIRFISAVTGGRVETVPVRPGAVVQPGTVLMTFSNPDVELQALSAQQSLAAAQAQLVSLRTQLESTRLGQESQVNATRAQLREAQRQLASARALIERNLVAPNELQRLTDEVERLEAQLRIEQQRLALQVATVDSQLTLQRDQIERLRAIAEFQQNRVASMRVTSGVEGVLVQDQLFEVGQWVMSGTTLARVVQPGRLKAVLRIPETQARDVALGQTADIDTHIGHVPGRVIRIDPGSTNGTVGVDIALEGPLPEGARPDLSIEGTITIERLANVLYMGRPAYGQANSSTSIFRLVDGGNYAERVNVRLGRGSVSQIEVVSGLNEGDVVILSDMSRWESVDRVRIK
jgi:HlyD family secretion protein